VPILRSLGGIQCSLCSCSDFCRFLLGLQHAFTSGSFGSAKRSLPWKA
jgi:hypothetical protein